MRTFSFILFPFLFIFLSCAESLEDQRIVNTEGNHIFEIDLEARRYDFGYINSTEGETGRPSVSRFRETIALTTADVSVGDGRLFGICQVIAIELEFSQPLGVREIRKNLRFANQGGVITSISVFLAEDFDFATGEMCRRINLTNGELIMEGYRNGARKITLDASAGGIPVRGVWAGELEAARVSF